jgi:hypothetical protein
MPEGACSKKPILTGASISSLPGKGYSTSPEAAHAFPPLARCTELAWGSPGKGLTEQGLIDKPLSRAYKGLPTKGLSGKEEMQAPVKKGEGVTRQGLSSKPCR